MPITRKIISVVVLLLVGFATGNAARAQMLSDVCFAVADGGNRGGLQDKQAEDFLALMDKVAVSAKASKK